MRSRAFNKRIDIYESTDVADGFGGNTVTNVLVTSSWADIKHVNINSNLSTELGILAASNSISLTMRKRNDITIDLETMFIMYRGEKYAIKSFPANVNFEDNVIKMICSK